MQTILNPLAAPRATGKNALPVIASLAGGTIGILSNHWKSMDRMATRMRTRLMQQYQLSDVRFYDIPINGAMSDAVRAAAIDECDAAIVGLAN